MQNSMHPIEKIVYHENCVGCGFCAATYKKTKDEKTKISMEYQSKKDFIIPKVEGWNPKTGAGEFVCPGEKVNMIELSKQVHGKSPKDYLLGVYQKLRVCYSTDQELRKGATSGGLIPEILKYLFETNKISSAYVLYPGDSPFTAKGIIIRDASQVSKLHGSVYHPTNYGSGLKELINGEGKFAFVGLPCQIHGLEMYKIRNKKFAERHCVSIGLFCGGVNKFGGISYYLNGYKIPWKEVKNIKYREGPWPGKIKVETTNGEFKLIPRIQNNTRMKIIRYLIAFQGYWMFKRCRLCPDQINDFADIAVGDPHLKKYKEKKSAGYSAVITRTKKGEEIIEKLIKMGRIESEDIDRDSMIKTQGYTLDNRRHSLAYLKINQLFGGKNPTITYYPEVEKNINFRHHKYAFVDLMKIYLPKHPLIMALYLPWQIFEYLFITLVPSIIVNRFKKVLTNK